LTLTAGIAAPQCGKRTTKTTITAQRCGESGENVNNFGDKVSFILSVANLLRGVYKPNEYKDVMLPLIVLRRLDCVLEPTKEAVLAEEKRLADSKVKNIEPLLFRVSGFSFYNTSRYTFENLKGDSNNIAANLTNYIKGFSTRAREIIDYFGFEKHIEKLDSKNKLYLVVSKFCEVDFHPDTVSNREMGYIFEELIRKFNEASKEEAGDHFTPREVIRLMVNLIFLPDNDILTTKGIVKTLFDPACGTGGMLTIAEDYLHELNPHARLEVFGQDYYDQTYAICGSDMMIKGKDIDHIINANSFTQDHFANKKFDYMLANPPFGVDWKTEADFIKREHDEQGYGGRFGAGLPSVDDGAFLFLQHMISKMKDLKEGGTRLAIVFSGSPLFSGSAGSGESDIRRWILENDWLEGIVALPDQLFYKTGIFSFLWIVTNRKAKQHKGKVLLVDARTFFKKMQKSLGTKRHEISDDQRDAITRLYGESKEGEFVRIFDTSDFCYRRVTVERPLRLNFTVTEERISRIKEKSVFIALATSKKIKSSKEAEEETAKGIALQDAILSTLTELRNEEIVKNREVFIELLKATFKKAKLAIPATLFKAILMALSERDSSADICSDSKGNPEPDPQLRDCENIPFKEDVNEYVTREVLPHVPDAWVDHSKPKIGYEINFNRYFYKYVPLRPLDEIESELKRIENEIADSLREIAL